MGTEPNSPAASRPGSGRRLVTTDNARGAPVYAPDGNRLGRVEGVMEDEATGEIVYAIVNFSPGKGIGFETDEYPVPWSLLRYNARFGGYELKIASRPTAQTS
jgi:sporulation protein YlmC with PRC-barrel domain